MTGHLDRLYEKAEAFLPWNASADVLNASVKPFWLPSSDAFWYRSMLPGSHEFRLFDVTGKASRPPFDHAALARAMSVPRPHISAKPLPFDQVQIHRQVAATRTRNLVSRFFRPVPLSARRATRARNVSHSVGIPGRRCSAKPFFLSLPERG